MNLKQVEKFKSEINFYATVHIRSNEFAIRYITVFIFLYLWYTYLTMMKILTWHIFQEVKIVWTY